jgi:predicted metalloprotease with PDZ domain
MDHQKGRAWRPLQDTAAGPRCSYARGDWASLRRGVDFYAESEPPWLEADTLIRRESRGRRSLDDFCRLFFGGESGPPRVVPYTFEDVVAALKQVLPYDWASFWKKRLETTEPGAPLQGVAEGGWRLVYSEEIPDMQRAAEDTRKVTDVRYSIGISVHDDGSIPDLVPGSPAAAAGLGPGMRLVAVNGRRWSALILREAIRKSKTLPIELLVESGEFFKTVRLDYAGPERYPHLERDAARPDLLSPILRPLAPRPAETKK